MLRPVLALERLTFLEPEGKIGYRWGRAGAEQETMDYLEFIARLTSHIPDKSILVWPLSRQFRLKTGRKRKAKP